MRNRNETSRFWLERLYVNKQVPFHTFNGKGEVVQIVGVKDGKEDPFETDKALFHTLYRQWNSGKYPVLHMEDNEILYMAFADDDGNFYVGGPVCIASAAEENRILHDYRRKHNLSGKFDHMTGLSLMETANILSMAAASICHLLIREMDLLKNNGISDVGTQRQEWELAEYRFESDEMEREHVSYDYERRMLDNIKSGNVEEFENISCEDLQMTEKVGKLAQNKGKQMEYMVAASITLVTRAAIEGGVPSDTAYAVSELKFQKLEQCRNMVDIIKLNSDMQKEFAGLVRRHKEQKKTNDYVKQCKNLIVQNIHEPLSVEKMARKIGINRSYLSSRFSAQVGMSISQYSIMVRVNAAENMLKYSNASIAQISDYLCFASQSYFGKVFKEKNGLTPSEYRNQNRVIDPLESKLAR